MLKLINLLILLLITGFLGLNLHIIIRGTHVYILHIILMIFAVFIGGLHLYVICRDDRDKGENS